MIGFFRLLGFTITSAALAGLAAAEPDVTVVTWGGDYTVSQQKAYGETWTAETGHEVRWVEYNGGLGEIRAQVQAGEVTWDVVDVFAHDARVGCEEGLFEPLPRERFAPAPDGTPMAQDVMIDIPNECVAPNIIWSWVPFYNVTRFGDDPPETIADFFDLERYPGTRAISAFPQANIEMALVADGVPPDRVYEVMSTPEGLDRAFAKLDTIKEHLVFWSSGAEPIALVTGGEVMMSTGYSGRVSSAMLEDDAPLAIIWDGHVIDEEWFVIVKGSENYQRALEFLIHATAPRQQAAQAKWIAYGPMRRSALDIIEAGEPWYHTGAEIMPHLPNRGPVIPRTVISDPDWWAANSERITQRFTDWMGR